MNLLAIETATEQCSVALAINNTCFSRSVTAPRQHTQLVLPMIDELLRAADIKIQDIDAISFTQGPGAFTGVRVAISVTQGLAYAHNIPVIPISTLAALAQQCAKQYAQVAVAIDARLNEVYWGLYQINETSLMQSVAKEKVCSPYDIEPVKNGDWFGAGSAWGSYAETLQSKLPSPLLGIDAAALPSATTVIELAKPLFLAGKMIAVENATPVYLREKITHNQ